MTKETTRKTSHNHLHSCGCFAIIASCSNSTRLAKHATTGLVCARLSSKPQMG